MPIQGLKFNINSSSESHLTFQATGSFTAYNPNDGYALIALDRTATALDYDHKLPSQSGGHFPGPINSYLSIYYVDQSGGGLAGQIIVYASPDLLQIPQFWSIGRAIQSQVTSMDIIQGPQPPNPPAQTSRLWVDSQGHLNIAQSNGTSFAVLDNTNYVSLISMGGDVIGPINNTTISMRNGSWANAHDAAGNVVPFFTVWSDNNVYINLPTNAGNFNFRNLGNSLLARIGADGTLTILSSGTFGSGLTVNTGRGANQGGITMRAAAAGNDAQMFAENGYVYFWLTSPSGQLLFQNNVNGAWAQVNCGPINATGQINGSAALALGGQANPNILYWEGSANSGGSINAGSYIVYPGLTVGGRIQAMQAWTGVLTANANAVIAPNIGDYRGQMLAFAYNTWSSVDHARQYGLRISPIQDPLKMVRAVSGYYYAHTSMKGDEPFRRDTGEIESNMTYGFAASEVNSQIPEMADQDSVDTSRLLVILWEAVKELDARLSSVEHPAPTPA